MKHLGADPASFWLCVQCVQSRPKAMQVRQGGVLLVSCISSLEEPFKMGTQRMTDSGFFFKTSSLTTNDQRGFTALVVFSDFTHSILNRSLMVAMGNADVSVGHREGDHFLARGSVCSPDLSQPSYFTLVFSVSTWDMTRDIPK